MNEKILWYIADPMCSWCWGFLPVIEAIRHEYGGRAKVELLLGGLRPGTKDPMPPAQRETILRHWRTVQRMTGQPFEFEDAMPEGFIYDTEPASRGVVTVSIINSRLIFPFFRAVQSAFYAGQRDVTHAVVLTQLATGIGLDAQRFREVFESDTANRQTLEHFNKARQWGVHGFPAVVMQNAAGYTPLTTGYRSFQELRPQLDEWLER
jgi:putative protein-disulfide isomerase